MRVLVLAECPIGREGAYLLAEMMAHNSSLNELVRCAGNAAGLSRPWLAKRGISHRGTYPLAGKGQRTCLPWHQLAAMLWPALRWTPCHVLCCALLMPLRSLCHARAAQPALMLTWAESRPQHSATQHAEHARHTQVLFNTQLRQEGACAVLEALCTNSTLQKVDLGGNDLGPEVCCVGFRVQGSGSWTLCTSSTLQKAIIGGTDRGRPLRPTAAQGCPAAPNGRALCGAHSEAWSCVCGTRAVLAQQHCARTSSAAFTFPSGSAGRLSAAGLRMPVWPLPASRAPVVGAGSGSRLRLRGSLRWAAARCAQPRGLHRPARHRGRRLRGWDWCAGGQGSWAAGAAAAARKPQTPSPASPKLGLCSAHH